MMIDSDAHINESLDALVEHHDSAFRDRAPRLMKDTLGLTRILMEGKLYPDPSGRRQLHGAPRRHGSRRHRPASGGRCWVRVRSRTHPTTPQTDSAFPRSVKLMGDRDDLSDEQKDRLLGANARRYYSEHLVSASG